MVKKIEMSERNIYLKNKDLDEAVHLYLSQIGFLNDSDQAEILPVIKSLHRVTAEPVFAKISSPFYNASAMDGICVNALEITGIDGRNPKTLTLHEDFEWVDTGDVITEPYNGVV
ncbi:MAG: molybdopterin biosynthesis protein, partial [Eubacterium sp.]